MERAKLTFGQLSLYRDAADYPRERRRERNVGVVWHLPESHPVARIQDAFAVLAGRYETLRARYELSELTPTQCIDEVPQRRLDVVDGGPSMVSQILDRFLDDEAIELGSDGPPWLGGIVTSHGVGVAVVLAWHAILCDAWTLRRLESEFRDILQGGPGGATPATPALSLADLARAQYGPEWATRRRLARQYWNRCLADPVMEDLVVDRPADLRPLMEAELTLSISHAVLHRSDPPSYGFPQGVVLAATLLALCSVQRTGMAGCGLLVSNRFGLEGQEVMTRMLQTVPLIVPVLPDESMTPFVARVQDAYSEACMVGCYDKDEMSAATENVLGRSGGLDYRFNYNVDSPAGTSTPSGPDSPIEGGIRWAPSPRVCGPRFYVRVTGRDRIVMNVRFDESLYARRDIERFLHDVDATIVGALAEPFAPCGRFMDQR